MSRADEATATKKASDQNTGYYDNSQNSYTAASADASNNEKTLGAYAAANPYVPGGTFQKATNQQLADTAQGTADAEGNALQAQALRTGENTSGAVAATEAMQQQAQRTLSGQEADATQKRIAAGAQYGQSVLAAGGAVEGERATLAGQQAQAAEGTLGEQVKAASTPSWTDQFGNAVANGLGKLVTVGAKG